MYTVTQVKNCCLKFPMVKTFAKKKENWNLVLSFCNKTVSRKKMNIRETGAVVWLISRHTIGWEKFRVFTGDSAARRSVNLRQRSSGTKTRGWPSGISDRASIIIMIKRQRWNDRSQIKRHLSRNYSIDLTFYTHYCSHFALTLSRKVTYSYKPSFFSTMILN